MKNNLPLYLLILFTTLACKKDVHCQTLKETDSEKKMRQEQELNFKQQDLQENVLKQFLWYTSNVIKSNQEIGATFDFEGDLTRDGKLDEIIYYEVLNKET
jgi:hypothetical protein